MNRKKKELNTSVGFRLSNREKQDLANLCEILGVTPSEFLRNQINKINSVIKETPRMKNLNKEKETEKAMEELSGEKQTLFSTNEEGETPAATTEGIVDQLLNAKKS